MTTSKTITLNKSQRSKADIQARIEAELSILPIAQLPKAPAKLKGHAIATKEWKFVVGLYGETLAQLITAFDETLLVNYCLLVEEMADTTALRAGALAMLGKLNAEKKRKASNTELAGGIEYITSAVFKATSMLARQRELLLKYSKDLYLTPKSRAGVAPPMKSAEPTRSELDDILSDATKDLND